MFFSLPQWVKPLFRVLQNLFILNLAAKLVELTGFLIQDLVRIVGWLGVKMGLFTLSLERSVIFSGGVVLGAVVLVLILLYGILVNAHNFRVKRLKVILPNLPAAFNGVKIAQISDLHIGGFPNPEVLDKAVDILLKENPDLIFFTGDLVNRLTEEAYPFKETLKRIKAPLGVFSILGNHDYGDYVAWNSPEGREKNNQDMVALHKDIGWNLLLNQNQIIKKGRDTIAILGVENWGSTLFAQYGKVEDALKGVEEVPVKLLLSHDPSHWEVEISQQYQGIDFTFSGHTHGGQIGIEWGTFQWSLLQYRYPYWAGLYQKRRQYLYVNRGLGHSQLYLGRVGILPEITMIELVSA